ncbi:MAG: DNA recombination protein RmuC [Spartobacteria bacterium]|nr:DNA recombination protein RmuC [Spartobacteria bacterium]
MIWTALSLLLGTAVGAFILWSLIRSRVAVLEERVSHREAELAEKREEAATWREDCRQWQEKAARLEQEQARLEAAAREERRGMEEKLQLLDESREKLKLEFEHLAHQIFEDRTQKLTDKSKAELSSLLTPLKEQLAFFRQRIDEVHTEESKGRASLLNEVQTLRRLNEQVSREAVNLTNALKGDTKKQGNWGELILERVLEESGLAKGREYETQVHLRDRHGGEQKRYPDVVVHLPEGRDVVIDSKISLKDYELFCSAETEAERETAFKAHVQSVRRHMDNLSQKHYEELEGINSLDIVILCIPVEPAFIAAVSRDNGLYEEGFRKRIMLVGPSTLLLTLRIIAAMWKQEDQTRNALAIADRGQRLYEKFVGFIADLEAVGKSLDQARNAYDQAYNKLTNGPGNLVGQSQKLLELGVKTKKKLPPELVEKSVLYLPE